MPMDLVLVEGIRNLSSMDVNFAATSVQVTNFTISMGTPGTSGVSIVGASGSISAGTSNFSVSGGTVWVDTGSAGTCTAYGSFYDPTGKQVGGVFQADAATNHANGIFRGSRP